MNSLEYLTEQDWRLLETQCRKVTFARDEIIIRQASKGRYVYIIREGHVRIERLNGALPVKIATLGPGDIIGEMAFVEDSLTSASVIADTSVKADCFEVPEMSKTFDAMPHVGSRFYRSIALALSRRLRATSGALAKAQPTP
jgi:CRP-like cAMP-binding protein